MRAVVGVAGPKTPPLHKPTLYFAVKTLFPPTSYVCRRRSIYQFRTHSVTAHGVERQTKEAMASTPPSRSNIV